MWVFGIEAGSAEEIPCAKVNPDRVFIGILFYGFVVEIGKLVTGGFKSGAVGLYAL